MLPMYLHACYIPTLQIHTTVLSLMTRLEETATGGAFKPGPQHDAADAAVKGAHVCLSVMLEASIKYFRLPIEVQRVHEIYESCWPGGSES